jgi:hypothetical protein
MRLRRAGLLWTMGFFLAGFAPAQDSWHPGDAPNPSAILSEAEDDARAGRYGDALAKHIWFHENALKFDPALYGVRLSFALHSWKSLGDSYPPALQKLRAERDGAADGVRAGKDASSGFHDFAAINQILEEDEKTRELFVWLDANRPPVATKVFGVAEPALVKAREYRICGKYLDPEPSFRRLVRLYEETKKMSEGSDYSREMGEFAEKSFTNGVSTLVALLVVNQRKAEADRIADEARKAWNDAGFRRQLDRALTGEVPPPWP